MITLPGDFFKMVFYTLSRRIFTVMLKIYPLFLREKITARLNKIIPLPGENVKLHFNENIKMNLEKQDTGHREIIYNGYYERPLSEKIVELAKTGFVLFDVGANYGYFSLLWASFSKANKVYSFEPSPKNYKALKENVDLNGLSKQIYCYDLALSDTNDLMKFQLNNDAGQTGWGGLTKENNSNDILVQTKTIDSFCEENGIATIDVLKIDTEGGDPLVLKGAEKMLSQKLIKHIFFETNSRMKELGIYDFAFPVKFVMSKGYKVVKLGGGGYAY